MSELPGQSDMLCPTSQFKVVPKADRAPRGEDSFRFADPSSIYRSARAGFDDHPESRRFDPPCPQGEALCRTRHKPVAGSRKY
jgi:hypothetical protein